MNGVYGYVVIMGIDCVDIFVVVFGFDEVFYDFFVFGVGEVFGLVVGDGDFWIGGDIFFEIFFVVDGWG